MGEFFHQRHKPPQPLQRPRELVLALPPLRSNVNLARIVRACGCSGVQRVIVAGRVKIDREIARDAADFVQIESHRSLGPVLAEMARDGYRLVGLEQATNSRLLTEYAFTRRSVLVVGHERTGIEDELLACMHDVVEIPIYGQPPSHNAATAAAIAIYEYCRQFPAG